MARLTKWCLGTVLGVLILSVAGNQISATVPNIFVWTWKKVFNTSPKQNSWYAAALKNQLKHDVTLTVWSDNDATWVGDTWKNEEVKSFVGEYPIRVMVQGDYIAQTEPARLTHTYEGVEAYILESTSFDHEPTPDELQVLKPNTIREMSGGPNPKFIPFVDGSRIPFDFFGPSGKSLKIEIEGESPDMLPNKFQPDAEIYLKNSNQANQP